MVLCVQITQLFSLLRLSNQPVSQYHSNFFLSTTYVVLGKVMFSLVSVILFRGWGGYVLSFGGEEYHDQRFSLGRGRRRGREVP